MVRGAPTDRHVDLLYTDLSVRHAVNCLCELSGSLLDLDDTDFEFTEHERPKPAFPQVISSNLCWGP